MVGGKLYPWAGIFAALDRDDQLSVAQLITEGGAIVGTAHEIRARLTNVRILVMLREARSHRIVGVGALKNPNPGYRLNKFGAACVPISGFEQAPELGYIVVAKDMRGKQLSGQLVELIASKISEPAFATTDNETMKNNLLRAGFHKVGESGRVNGAHYHSGQSAPLRRIISQATRSRSGKMNNSIAPD